VVALAAATVGYYWYEINRNQLPDGVVSTNGRFKAEQLEIATKLPGRIAEVLANEGELVDAGAVVAHMDTTELQAQLAQAEAEVRRTAQAEVQASALIALCPLIRTTISSRCQRPVGQGLALRRLRAKSRSNFCVQHRTVS
jgi:HlyD family secretion protein